jgi:hypothetical protein
MHDEHKINTLLGDCACLFAVCLSACFISETVQLNFTVLPGFPGHVLFPRLPKCVYGDFLIFQKCADFWPLSVVRGGLLYVQF